MSTQLGKELKKLRIDLGITLGDMAEAIGKSASFLSAVETGRKRAPDDLLNLLASKYETINQNRNYYEALINHSRKELQLPEDTSVSEVELAMALTRRFKSMTDDHKIELHDFLQRLQE